MAPTFEIGGTYQIGHVLYRSPHPGLASACKYVPTDSNHIPGHSTSLQWPSLMRCPPVRKKWCLNQPDLLPLCTGCQPTLLPTPFPIVHGFLQQSITEAYCMLVHMNKDEYDKEFPTWNTICNSDKTMLGQSRAVRTVGRIALGESV